MADYLDEVARLIQAVPREAVRAAGDRLWRAYCEGAQIFACGNGGSSATASHFVEDLAKGVHPSGERRRVRAISLVDSVAALTAYANDVGYEHIFAEPLRNLVQPGDVLVAISGSGSSENVIRAMAVARESGAAVVGLTGGDGGRMKALADICVVVPGESMQQIEDVHLAISHALYLDLSARARERLT